MKRNVEIKHDPRSSIFLAIIGHIFGMTNQQLEDVAEEANCTPHTLRNWRDAKVFSPQLNKIVGVARALGYNIELSKKRPLLYQVKK